MTALQIELLTLFPDMVNSVARAGILGRALDRGLVEINCRNPRDYTTDPRQTVDDRPYGGGPGMLMMVSPLREAIKVAREASDQPAKVIYMSPQGKQVNQAMIREAASQAQQGQRYIFLAGRYEGIDERIIDLDVDEEWSIGDYVLSGGELAAMVVIDAMARMIPGVLGDDQSAEQDSFMQGLLDCPHYTRPELVDGESVPDVLLSGDHEAIRRWRLKQSVGRTWSRRPDLLEQMDMDEELRDLLDEYQREHKQ